MKIFSKVTKDGYTNTETITKNMGMKRERRSYEEIYIKNEKQIQ